MPTEPQLSIKALESLADEFIPYDHGVCGILQILATARKANKEYHLKQLLIQFTRHDFEFKGEWVTRSELTDLIQENNERKHEHRVQQ